MLRFTFRGRRLRYAKRGPRRPRRLAAITAYLRGLAAIFTARCRFHRSISTTTFWE